MPDVISKKLRKSDSELIGISRSILLAMRRDIAEFADYNIHQSDVDDFETMIEEFMDYPDDDVMKNDVSIAADKKNKLRQDLYLILMDFRSRAKITFASDKAKYNLFVSPNYRNLKDEELLVGSRSIAANAQEYLTELSGTGMTQAMNDELNAKNTEFENAMHEKQAAVAARINTTVTRINKANEIYDTIKKYCNIGKTIWYDSNEAKYNDYLIFTGEKNRPGKIRKLEFDATNGWLTWKANAKSTDYQAEAAEAKRGARFAKFYEGSETEARFVPEKAGRYKLRVRGLNEEIAGLWSSELTVEVE